MKYLLIFLGLSAVVATVIWLAVWKYEQQLTPTIAVAAFVLTVLKIGFDLFEKYQADKAKAEERTERVTAEINFNAGSFEIEVVIFNLSYSRAVPIESVRLVTHDADGKLTDRYLVTGTANSCEIESRRRVIFKESCEVRSIKAILAMKSYDVWVSVFSHEKEIHRIHGEKTLAALRQYVAAYDSQSSRAK